MPKYKQAIKDFSDELKEKGFTDIKVETTLSNFSRTFDGKLLDQKVSVLFVNKGDKLFSNEEINVKKYMNSLSISPRRLLFSFIDLEPE